MRQETRVWSLGWEVPLEKGVAIHSSILDGEFYGQRSLVGCSPWGRKEWDTTQWPPHTTHMHGPHLKTPGSESLVVDLWCLHFKQAVWVNLLHTQSQCPLTGKRPHISLHQKWSLTSWCPKASHCRTKALEGDTVSLLYSFPASTQHKPRTPNHVRSRVQLHLLRLPWPDCFTNLNPD